MSDTQTTALNFGALHQKYLAERDKRLRAEGAAQYVEMDHPFIGDVDDPYAGDTIVREAVSEDVDVAIVGAGFSGLLAAASLLKEGVSDIRIVEKGSDVGGTWYWNRYPGCRCDVDAYTYLPLIEDHGEMPRERYSRAPDILDHARRIAQRTGLYNRTLLQTGVSGAAWDEASGRWIVTTDRGDKLRARFVCMASGILSRPKLPGIPGAKDFKGHSFHTSRWDYDYTKGGATGGLTGLKDKRVAIIGTGATAVQCVPHLAKACKELFVIQRTPSSVDVRANAPIDPDWFAGIAQPGWQQRWLENFTENQAGGTASEDLVQDGWTDLSRRIRARMTGLPREQMNLQTMLAAYEESDFEKMEEIRARTDTVVQDKATADKLKAWYRQLCKRPCFHDEYLRAFNEPGTHLIDTDGQGVERITEKGVVVAGVEYEVDCIIYASGFEVGTAFTGRAGFDLTGRDGVRLSQAWADGMRSKHGVHVHGFPNLFFAQPSQGANLISNVPHNLTEAGKTIAAIVREAQDRGAREVEVTQAAQEAWVELLMTGPGRMTNSPDCTPGYYNNEGQPNAAARYAVGYPAGAAAYFRYIDAWRASGAFEGLEFR